MSKVIIIGAGGHAKSILDCVDSVRVHGLIGIESEVGQIIMGHQVIGTDEDLQSIYDSGIKEAFIAVGSVGDNKIRYKLFENLSKIGFGFVKIVDPSAIISKDAVVGNGTFVGKGAVVNAGAVIGSQCVINTRAVVEHDVKMEDFVQVGPGAVVCGQVSLERSSFIGANSTVVQGIRVGKNALIGAGSVVVNHIEEDSVAFGNPCKMRKRR